MWTRPASELEMFVPLVNAGTLTQFEKVTQKKEWNWMEVRRHLQKKSNNYECSDVETWDKGGPSLRIETCLLKGF